MKIVLLGYMGCGKTVIGKHLANTLAYPFIDLDDALEKDQNMSISRIFESKGELYFRKKEQQVLIRLLQDSKFAVLSLGGGTPCYGEVMRLLIENSEVMPLYLSASLQTLTERLFLEKDKRPLISHISEKEILHDFIRKHLFERSFYYNQARYTIKVDDKTIPHIVEEIVARLF